MALISVETQFYERFRERKTQSATFKDVQDAEFAEFLLNSFESILSIVDTFKGACKTKLDEQEAAELPCHDSRLTHTTDLSENTGLIIQSSEDSNAKPVETDMQFNEIKICGANEDMPVTPTEKIITENQTTKIESDQPYGTQAGREIETKADLETKTGITESDKLPETVTNIMDEQNSVHSIQPRNDSEVSSSYLSTGKIQIENMIKRKRGTRARKARPVSFTIDEHASSSSESSKIETVKAKKVKQKPSTNKETAARIGKDGRRMAQYFYAGKLVSSTTGKTRLQRACEQGDVDDVREFLKCTTYSALNKTDFYYSTAVHYAIRNGHSECALMLLNHPLIYLSPYVDGLIKICNHFENNSMDRVKERLSQWIEKDEGKSYQNTPYQPKQVFAKKHGKPNKNAPEDEKVISSDKEPVQESFMDIYESLFSSTVETGSHNVENQSNQASDKGKLATATCVESTNLTDLEAGDKKLDELLHSIRLKAPETGISGSYKPPDVFNSRNIITPLSSVALSSADSVVGRGTDSRIVSECRRKGLEVHKLSDKLSPLRPRTPIIRLSSPHKHLPSKTLPSHIFSCPSSIQSKSYISNNNIDTNDNNSTSEFPNVHSLNYKTLSPFDQLSADLSFRCSQCGKVFMAGIELDDHLFTVHFLKPLYLKQLCQFCKLTFKNAEQLHTHQTNYCKMNANSLRSKNYSSDSSCSRTSITETIDDDDEPVITEHKIVIADAENDLDSIPSTSKNSRSTRCKRKTDYEMYRTDTHKRRSSSGLFSEICATCRLLYCECVVSGGKTRKSKQIVRHSDNSQNNESDNNIADSGNDQHAPDLVSQQTADPGNDEQTSDPGNMQVSDSGNQPVDSENMSAPDSEYQPVPTSGNQPAYDSGNLAASDSEILPVSDSGNQLASDSGILTASDSGNQLATDSGNLPASESKNLPVSNSESQGASEASPEINGQCTPDANGDPGMDISEPNNDKSLSESQDDVMSSVNIVSETLAEGSRSSEAANSNAANFESANNETVNFDSANNESVNSESAYNEADNSESVNNETANSDADYLEAAYSEATDLEVANSEATDLEAANSEATDLEAVNSEAMALKAVNSNVTNFEAANSGAASLEAANSESVSLFCAPCQKNFKSQNWLTRHIDQFHSI